MRRIGAEIDVTERKRAEERQRLLISELDHRVKNTLATVSAVVSHTRQGSRSVANFAAVLDGRIRSMATTHKLLSFGRWQGLSLTELVRRELAPYSTRNNTEINGPEVVLTPEAGQAMAMVLHELTTNAAKYGALSTRNGRVSIWWGQRPNGHSRSHLVFEWQEIGGPTVEASGEHPSTSSIAEYRCFRAEPGLRPKRRAALPWAPSSGRDCARPRSRRGGRGRRHPHPRHRPHATADRRT